MTRISVVLFGLLPVVVAAADWPQWRGPNRDGISTDTGLLQTWPADGPALRWKAKDIGTGYSGVSSIDRLRPDFLKVDISLVRRIDASLIQQDVLSSLVSIGRRAGAEVIAEGIESPRELEYLRGHGARYGQGFLFSGPVPTMLPGPFAIQREH